MAGMAGFSREVAKRVFAEELKSSNYSFRDGQDQNQYAPSYLLTPTGAKCNRVFVVGTLTEKDDIGGDTEYWRGRVVDPTGSILIYAGQYQPEAAQILASMDAPSFVAVVGKPNLYQTDDGNIIISLRAESIQKVDETTRNQWIMDAARRTLERLEDMKKVKPAALSSDFATADSVTPVPASTGAQDAERALSHYHTDIDHFRQMVLRALESLKADISKTASEPKAAPGEKKAAEKDEESVIKRVSDEAPAPKKAKPKKSESLSGWPETESDDDVETINIGKKN
jgi:RPA family protein